MLETANSILSKYYDGNEELGMVSIDPLRISNMTIEQASQKVVFVLFENKALMFLGIPE